VSKTITGKPVRIIAYQLIVEVDVEPHRHMIGKFGLSMYLPRSVTCSDVPDGFLERGTAYNWEVLAIERSGNQTLSSGSLRTRSYSDECCYRFGGASVSTSTGDAPQRNEYRSSGRKASGTQCGRLLACSKHGSPLWH
jgi:hypothetical protein